MMKLIPIISNEAPKMKNALWIKPVDGHFNILTLNNGSWQEQQDTVPEVTDITAIPAKVLDSLKCGDKIAKITGNQKHLYSVSYKGKVLVRVFALPMLQQDLLRLFPMTLLLLAGYTTPLTSVPLM